jgi:hypothetical protein
VFPDLGKRRLTKGSIRILLMDIGAALAPLLVVIALFLLAEFILG